MIPFKKVCIWLVFKKEIRDKMDMRPRVILNVTPVSFYVMKVLPNYCCRERTIINILETKIKYIGNNRAL